MSELEALWWCRRNSATIDFMGDHGVMVAIRSGNGKGVVTPTLIESVMRLKEIIRIDKADETVH